MPCRRSGRRAGVPGRKRRAKARDSTETERAGKWKKRSMRSESGFAELGNGIGGNALGTRYPSRSTCCQWPLTRRDRRTKSMRRRFSTAFWVVDRGLMAPRCVLRIGISRSTIPFTRPAPVARRHGFRPSTRGLRGVGRAGSSNRSADERVRSRPVSQRLRLAPADRRGRGLVPAPCARLRRARLAPARPPNTLLRRLPRALCPARRHLGGALPQGPAQGRGHTGAPAAVARRRGRAVHRQGPGEGPSSCVRAKSRSRRAAPAGIPVRGPGSRDG